MKKTRWPESTNANQRCFDPPDSEIVVPHVPEQAASRSARFTRSAWRSPAR